VSTADQIAARTARAVAAATAAGRSLGLPVDDPRVLHDVFSVVVHLAPAPVVARVPTMLPRSYAEDPGPQTGRQRTELAVTGWLADRGQPVVAPTPLLPREPVRRDGFSMTFWEYVDERRDVDPPLEQRFDMTARLHAALRDYDGPGLGFWAPLRDYIGDGLAELKDRPDLLDPADHQRAQRQWDEIGPALASREAFEAAFPGVAVQPIHGDAPSYNLICTAAGLRWSDFELVTVGPVEFDLAMTGDDGAAAYDDAATRLGLRTLDVRVRRLTEAAGQLAAVACLALVPQLPLLAEALAPAVDAWRG